MASTQAQETSQVQIEFGKLAASYYMMAEQWRDNKLAATDKNEQRMFERHELKCLKLAEGYERRARAGG